MPIPWEFCNKNNNKKRSFKKRPYFVAENHIPTDLFTASELENPSHDVPKLHKICRSINLEALKL